MDALCDAIIVELAFRHHWSVPVSIFQDIFEEMVGSDLEVWAVSDTVDLLRHTHRAGVKLMKATIPGFIGHAELEVFPLEEEGWEKLVAQTTRMTLQGKAQYKMLEHIGRCIETVNSTIK